MTENKQKERIEYGDLLIEIRKALEPHFSDRTFKQGEFLWSEGDTDGMLVSLVSGQVKIYRLLPEGRAVTMYIFDSGELFGFMPLFDDAPYPAYAQALGDVQARVISRSAIHNIVRQNPDIGLLLLKQLSRRLRESFDQIERFSTHGVVPKVAAAIVTLLRDADHMNGMDIATLASSSHEYAALIGLTPESFSRGITKLVDMGILHRLGANSFQVLKKEDLLKQSKTHNW
jgi:CRP/FNR family transcriptional regulator